MKGLAMLFVVVLSVAFLGTGPVAAPGCSCEANAFDLGDVKKVEKVAKDVKDVGEAFTIDDEKEMEIGASVHPYLLEELGGSVRNSAVTGYVEKIGRKLAAKSSRSRIDYHFTVVDDSMINAFALPGGYIYITRGMLATLQDEAELAAVLGHEVGHVEKRHGVDQIKSMVVAEKGTKYAAGAAGKAGGALGEKLTRKIADVFARMALSGYGRSQELEADRAGIQFANSSGYDPDGAVRLFETLLELTGGKKGGIFASHPDTQKRIEEAKKEITGLSKRGKATNKAQYASIQQRI